MIRLALLASTALVATQALADPAPLPETHVSPAGHAFTLLPVAEADYVHVQLFWPGGAALAEPGREGLYALGPQLVFEEAGGRRLDEIGETLNDAGANAMVANTVEGTHVILQAMAPEGLAPAAEVANDALTDAALLPDDLDWVMRSMSDGLAESERDPGTLMDRTLTMLLGQGDRRVAALTNRPFETVEAVTVDDVRTWLSASFDAAPLAVVAGPVTPEAAGAAIDATLAGLDERPAPIRPEPLVLRTDVVTAVIDAPEAETALVAVAFPISPIDPAVSVALDALAGSDDARLFARLREADGATYGVSLTFTPLTSDLVSAALIAQVPPARAQEALDTLRAEIAAIRADGVTEAELAGARERTASFEAEFLRDPAILSGAAVEQVSRGGAIDPEALRTSDDMTDLAAINAALPAALPAEVVGVIVTPEPALATGDCTGATPETLAGCDVRG